MHSLSKSTYMRGLQCEKSLWLHKHGKQLRDEIDPALQKRFDVGTAIGQLAQELFPGGRDATPENFWDYSDAIEKTNTWMLAGVNTIYEAAFMYKGVLAANDILVNRDGRWYSFEVKSSTSVKEYHLEDAALQYWVMRNSGVELADISIIYLKNEYSRKGDIDIYELFTTESVLEIALQIQDSIEDRIEAMKEVLKQKDVPEVPIGQQCGYKENGCDFLGHCWQHISGRSVFELNRIGNKAWKLYAAGITDQNDIEDESILSENQQIQLRGTKYNEAVFDAEKVSKFLDSLQYPIYMFDFETINPAVPLFDHTRPYQQIPFQYSIHKLESAESDPIHLEFLADPKNGDSRSDLVKNLLEHLGTKGSVLAWNLGFEKSVLGQLAERFEDHAGAIADILNRADDLMTPFSKFWVYDPEQRGSSSIKAVLPTIAPDFTYKDLNIQEGGTASNTFEAMMVGTFEGDEQQTRDDLLRYCELDTLSMVKVFQYLNSKV